MHVGVVFGVISLGGKYAILLGAFRREMLMSWLSSVLSSVMKRIAELQISEGERKEM